MKARIQKNCVEHKSILRRVDKKSLGTRLCLLVEMVKLEHSNTTLRKFAFFVSITVACHPRWRCENPWFPSIHLDAPDIPARVIPGTWYYFTSLQMVHSSSSSTDTQETPHTSLLTAYRTANSRTNKHRV